MEAVCFYCGCTFDKKAGHLNRARKVGLNVFCSREHFGLSKRKDKEEKKRVKAEYDRKLRAEKVDELKAKKAEYFKKDYAANPEKYKAQRQRRYPKHLQYLQSEQYKEYKKEYDELYRAKKLFGDFAEAAIILKKLEGELDSKSIKYASGITQNKSTQKRKRLWKNLQRLT